MDDGILIKLMVSVVSAGVLTWWNCLQEAARGWSRWECCDVMAIEEDCKKDTEVSMS